MRYDPATSVRSAPLANTGGSALSRPVSSMRPLDRDDAAGRQAAELDVWEDEGGAISGHASEFQGRHAKRHFDELSG